MQGEISIGRKALAVCLLVLFSGHGWAGNDWSERNNSLEDSDIECVYDSRVAGATTEPQRDDPGNNASILVGNDSPSLQREQPSELTSDDELGLLIDEMIEQRRIDGFNDGVEDVSHNVSSSLASLHVSNANESNSSMTVDQQQHAIPISSQLLFDESSASPSNSTNLPDSESSWLNRQRNSFSHLEFNVDNAVENSATPPHIHNNFEYSPISNDSVHLGNSFNQLCNAQFDGFHYPASPTAGLDVRSPTPSDQSINQTTDLQEETPPTPPLPRPRWRFPTIFNRSDTSSLPEQFCLQQSSTPIATEYSPISSRNTSTQSDLTNTADPPFVPPSTIAKNSQTSLPRRSNRLQNNWFEMLIEPTNSQQPSTSTHQHPSTSSTSMTQQTTSLIGRAPTALDHQQSTSEQDPCSVCKNEIVVGSTVEPCHHRFHRDCMDTWLIRHNGKVCPLCRRVVEKMRHENENGSMTLQNIAPEETPPTPPLRVVLPAAAPRLDQRNMTAHDAPRLDHSNMTARETQAWVTWFTRLDDQDRERVMTVLDRNPDMGIRDVMRFAHHQ